MLKNCLGTQRQRLLNKFTESDHEKVSDERSFACFICIHWCASFLHQLNVYFCVRSVHELFLQSAPFQPNPDSVDTPNYAGSRVIKKTLVLDHGPYKQIYADSMT